MYIHTCFKLIRRKFTLVRILNLLGVGVSRYDIQMRHLRSFYLQISSKGIDASSPIRIVMDADWRIVTYESEVGYIVLLILYSEEGGCVSRYETVVCCPYLLTWRLIISYCVIKMLVIHVITTLMMMITIIAVIVIKIIIIMVMDFVGKTF